MATMEQRAVEEKSKDVDEGSHNIVKQEELISSAAPTEIIESPRKIDVLFGRGKKSQDHHGNQRMREISEKHKSTYFNIKRYEKQKLVEAVFKKIQEGGTRFLKRADGDGWVQVRDNMALEKVSHCLRSRRYVQPKDARSLGIERTGLMPPSTSGIPACLSYRRMSTSAISNSSSAMMAPSRLSANFARRWSDPSHPSICGNLGSFPSIAMNNLSMASLRPVQVREEMPLPPVYALHSSSMVKLRYLTLMEEELKLKKGIVEVEKHMHRMRMQHARTASINRYVSRTA
jgi:hypothetical protein